MAISPQPLGTPGLDSGHEGNGAGNLTAVEAAELGLEPAVKPRSMLRRGWEVFAENRLALVSIVVLVVIFGFCFIGPLIYHTDQIHTNLDETLCRPSGSHLLGCNELGYDQLGRLMVGGRVSLEVGL